jgi:hypothetical protein
MKKLLLLTAVIAATATATLADQTPRKLPQTMQVAILQLVPDADLSNLTNGQWARFHVLFSNSANLRAGEDPAARIKIILASED